MNSKIKDLINITDSAKFVGISRTSIYNLLKQKKLSIKRIGKSPFIDKNELVKFKEFFKGSVSMADKVHRVKQNHFIWNDEMKQILDGELLGDGCLQRYKNRPLIDYYFVLGINSKEYCEYIVKSFPMGLFNNRVYLSKNNKTYFIKSRSDPYLTEQHKRWYKNKKEIIPSDLKLTPKACFHWYICDGHLAKRENRNSYINLYTDRFDKKQIEKILIKQLIDIGFNAKIFKHYRAKNDNRGFAIRISTDSTRSFLNFIGKPIIKDYKYKWDRDRKIEIKN